MKSFYCKQPYADEQVRAIIEGRKTLMVFPVKIQPESEQFTISKIVCSTDKKERGKYRWVITNDEKTLILKSSESFRPPFEVGERYWLKEALILWPGCATYRSDQEPCRIPYHEFRSFFYNHPYATCPSIHMPQWASRFTMEVTRVYVKRVRDIDEDECKKFGARFTDFGAKCWHYGGVRSAEGCPYPKETHQQNNGWHIVDAPNSDYCLYKAKSAVANWFEYKIKSDSWQRNDWCWFVEFKGV